MSGYCISLKIFFFRIYLLFAHRLLKCNLCKFTCVEKLHKLTQKINPTVFLLLGVIILQMYAVTKIR